MPLISVPGGGINPDFDLHRLAWEGLFHGRIAVGCYLEDGTIVFSNEAMLDVLGHTVEQLNEKGWIAAIYPDPADQARTYKIVSERLTREYTRHQRTITRSDGSKRLIHMASVPVVMSDGRKGVVTAAVDVTRFSEPFFASQAEGGAKLVEEATTFLARIEVRTGCVLFVSPSCHRLLGYTTEELQAAVPGFFESLILPEYRPAVVAAAKRCLEGSPQWLVVGAQRRDRSTIMLQMALYPVTDARGHVEVIETVARDVTAVRTLERELEKTIAELKERNASLASLDRLKSQLLATVSHELRTPLVSIKGYTELLLRGSMGPLTDRQRRGLQISATSTDRLIEMIETLLDFSAQSQLNLRHDLVDVRVPLRAALGQVESRIAARGISLAARLDDSPLTVLGDGERLRQVFQALLSNAEKFREGHGEIHVSASSADDEVVITVADDGIGIPLAAQKRIFDQFYQVDASVTRRYGGAGLGLALAREIITLHGGRISVDSVEGKGASFQVRLPRASATELPAVDEQSVVVVGAEAHVARQIGALLDPSRFCVATAATVPMLLRRARRHRPHAVILAFPVEGIREVLGSLCVDPAAREFPVITIASRDEQPDIAACATMALPREHLADLPLYLGRLLDPPSRLEGRGARVVIVSDDPAGLDFARFVLEGRGFEVLTALTAAEGLARVEGCDLLILDAVLEGGDGVEFCRRVRQIPEVSDVPVLMLTALTSRETYQEALAAGVRGFLIKPFGADELLLQVRLHRRGLRSLENP